ncbi:unnamed protein product [Cyclocybe aegerita]|uniref:Glucose receptor Git3 N-terminal domain-containing protein n=1 Tax=Cyclocybe aegerita TaxID=1973307 RepID=A0A8S0WM26_CYCAE|nr:unnamed protein product [Cyclocybe aegerita]
MSFTFGQRLGIFFTIEGSVLSAVSVTFILFFALYKWLRRTVRTWGKPVMQPSDASDSSLFLNLMLADLIQAIGNMPNIKWMADAEITEGPLCTAQAVIKQIGIVGVAMTSLAIAVHTFSILVLRWRAPRHISKFVVVGVWVFTALVIGIPNAVHRNERYYGPTGYWCWIVTEYKVEQIVTEYLWVWVAGLSMAILYTLMFVVMRGWFIIDNGIHWHKNYNPVHHGAAAPETEEDKESKAIAKMMLFYPAVYIFSFFPNSLARWLFFSGYETPYQFSLFASTVYSLSGMFNLILFFVTRPALVVGPNVTFEETLPLSQAIHRKSSSRGTKRLGHLPDIHYDASPDVDIEKRSDGPDFDPRMFTDKNNLSYSPASRYGSLPTPTPPPGRGNTIEYLSVDRNGSYQRSKGSSSLTEEEDYGHLPG